MKDSIKFNNAMLSAVMDGRKTHTKNYGHRYMELIAG